MELSSLLGPFELTLETISSLEHLAGCAIYVMGRTTPEKEFAALRVGQTDIDISVHLRQFQRHYPIFYYSPCASSEEAYIGVCHFYHELLPSDNVTHPIRPNGVTVACPVCGREDVRRDNRAAATPLSAGLAAIE